MAETQTLIFVGSGDTIFLNIATSNLLIRKCKHQFLIKLFSNFILGDGENNPKNSTEMKTSILVGNHKSLETQTSIFIGPEPSNKDSN